MLHRAFVQFTDLTEPKRMHCFVLAQRYEECFAREDLMRFFISALAFVALSSCEASSVQVSDVEQPIYYQISNGTVVALFDTRIWPAVQVESGIGDLCIGRKFGTVQYDFSQELASARAVCQMGGEIPFGRFEGSQSPVRGLNMKRVG